jgi:hypothetical protein
VKRNKAGDGSIFLCPDGRPCVSLIGALSLVSQFADFCRRHSAFRGKPKQSSENCWQVNLHGSTACLIARKMFNPCPWALPRKKAIAHQIDQTFDEEGFLRPEFGGFAERRRKYRWVDRSTLLEAYRRSGNWPGVCAALGLSRQTAHKLCKARGVVYTDPLGSVA